jgi:hypothetical protein
MFKKEGEIIKIIEELNGKLSHHHDDNGNVINRTPAIRNLPLRVIPIFANKNHALNTLKMGPLLRINVMLPQGVSGYCELVRLVEL